VWTCYDHDPERGVDVAYMLLAEDHPGEAAIKTVMVEPLMKQGLPTSVEHTIKSLILEFDSEDRLIAIEIWGASTVLPKSFLEMAAHETRPKPISPK
jgi:uncharacterized protein YuzE